MVRNFPTAAVCLALGLALACAPRSLLAATTLPTGAEMQRLHNVLNESIITEATQNPVIIAQETSTAVPITGPTFHLTGVEVETAPGLNPQPIQKAFTYLVGKKISVADLQNALTAVNANYRRQGHLLARAYLPPQQFSAEGAIVKVTVAQGHIGTITVSGTTSPYISRTIAQLEHQIRTNGLQSDDLENSLLTLNALPGTRAQANLSAGETPGSSNIAINLATTPWQVGYGLNNDGTRYLGPNQAQLEGTLNNPLLGQLGWQDQLTARLVQTPRLRELTYASLAYQVPLSTHGTNLTLNGSTGVSRPGWSLESLDIQSTVTGFGLEVSQNITRQLPLTLDAFTAFDWQDSRSTSFGIPLSTDHLRELSLGLRAKGQTDIGGRYGSQIALIHGLNAFNATDENNIGSSRLRGTGHGYTRLTLDGQVTQPITQNLGFMLQGSGQYSSHALLAGAEFALGGEQYGRGYDAQELVGDMGLGARAEIQFTFRPDTTWVPWYQLFGFIDGGMVWNKDDSPLDPDEESLMSNGFGIRIPVKDYLQTEFVLAKPRTRNLASTGEDNPQFYFRLSGKLDALP